MDDVKTRLAAPFFNGCVADISRCRNIDRYCLAAAGPHAGYAGEVENHIGFPGYRPDKGFVIQNIAGDFSNFQSEIYGESSPGQLKSAVTSSFSSRVEL